MKKSLPILGFCPTKTSAQRFTTRNPVHISKQIIFGTGFIVFGILLVYAWALIELVTAVTWISLTVSIAMFHFIRRFTLKLISAHYNVYSIARAFEELDRGKTFFSDDEWVQWFYDNQEKIKLTSRGNIAPVALQFVAEGAGFRLREFKARQLLERLLKKYPNLVEESRARAPHPKNRLQIAV